MLGEAERRIKDKAQFVGHSGWLDGGQFSLTLETQHLAFASFPQILGFPVSEQHADILSVTEPLRLVDQRRSDMKTSCSFGRLHGL